MAKSKKDLILEAAKQQPNITPEEAAEVAECTIAYAKRILAAEQEKLNSDIAAMGLKAGLKPEELEDWRKWVIDTLTNPRAIVTFRHFVLHRNYVKEVVRKDG